MPSCLLQVRQRNFNSKDFFELLLLINNYTQLVYSLYVRELDSGNVFLTVSSVFLQNSNTYPCFNFYSFLSARYHTAIYSVVLGRGSEIMKKKISAFSSNLLRDL
jgi:hypothetical protein